MPSLSEQITINSLPTEIIAHIFDYLYWRDLLNTRLVYRRWRDISDSHRSWKLALEIYFPRWQDEGHLLITDASSYQCVFVKLYLDFSTGLTAEECRFFEAVICNQAAIVDSMLIKNRNLCNATNAKGHQALDYAKHNDDKGILSILIHTFINIAKAQIKDQIKTQVKADLAEFKTQFIAEVTAKIIADMAPSICEFRSRCDFLREAINNQANPLIEANSAQALYPANSDTGRPPVELENDTITADEPLPVTDEEQKRVLIKVCQS